MFSKSSRYRNAQPFTSRAGGSGSFPGIRPRQIRRATGVIEHQVKADDRLDLLARHYYNDDRLWWRIVDANPEFLYGGDMVLRNMEGGVILIPQVRE